jgi:hypothetical protein
MSVEDFSEALKRKATQDAETWDDPVPLYAEHQRPAPYPVDALPPIIRDAVETYQAFGRQPIELVSCSALAGASLVCQALADVDRDGGNLTGPCSLSFLTIAGSGDRKTAVDTRMRRAPVTWQAEKRHEQAPLIKAAERRLAIWQAKHDGILNKIKRLSGSTKADDEIERQQLESKILALETERPKIPPEVRLFHEDTSSEKLAINLADGWPSSSLWSDEAGLIVGSHAMSEASALGFLTLLNRLWDGNEFDRERVTRSCAHIRGRRFTCSLMLQPSALAVLTSTGGGIARGVGALARFLMAWPNSTIGTREYRVGTLDAPALQAFDARARQRLDTPLPLDQDGALAPPKLRLSRTAFEVWRRLHDTIERELGPRGEFADLVDIGAKAAEQSARLSCVLHVFEHGPHGEISQQTVLSAGRIALWHLHEARRIFAMIGHAGETADAQVLLQWLLEQPEAPWLPDILRFAPYRVRDKERRDRAIAVLTQHGLARVEIRDRRQYLAVNPEVRK